MFSSITSNDDPFLRKKNLRDQRNLREIQTIKVKKRKPLINNNHLKKLP